MKIFKTLLAISIARPRCAVGYALVALVVLGALFAPLLAPYDPIAADANAFLQPPSAEHWLGTDAVGMDILSRVLYAPRIDLMIALAGTLLSALIGTALGLSVGYHAQSPGWRQRVSFGVMRTADVLQAFPVFIFAIALVASLGQSIQTVVFAIAFVNAPIYLRLMRNQAVSARNLRFVEAASIAGLSAPRIMVRHVLPNCMGPVLAQVSINIGWSVLLAAGLSFVGAGVRPPTPELGSMIASGFQNVATGQWWPSVFPGIVLAFVVLGFSLVGESLEIMADPAKMRSVIHDINMRRKAAGAH